MSMGDKNDNDHDNDVRQQSPDFLIHTHETHFIGHSVWFFSISIERRCPLSTHIYEREMNETKSASQRSSIIENEWNGRMNAAAAATESGRQYNPDIYMRTRFTRVWFQWMSTMAKAKYNFSWFSVSLYTIMSAVGTIKSQNGKLCHWF